MTAWVIVITDVAKTVDRRAQAQSIHRVVVDGLNLVDAISRVSVRTFVVADLQGLSEFLAPLGPCARAPPELAVAR